MLNVERLNCWLNSDETRLAIRYLNEDLQDLKEVITNGSYLQDKSVEKISLDYTYTLGQIDGLTMAIELIKDISSIVEEDSDN